MKPLAVLAEVGSPTPVAEAGETAAGLLISKFNRRIMATLFSLVGLILLVGSVVAITEWHNPPGPMEFPYLARLSGVITSMILSPNIALSWFAFGRVAEGVLLVVIATSAIWLQYWALLVVTIWLPVGWRKVRFVIWLAHFVMAIMVSAGLVVSGAALYVVVIDGFRSLAIQVLGTYTVFRAYVPARWIVRLHGCVYLGIPLLFVLAAAWSRAVDV